MDKKRIPSLILLMIQSIFSHVLVSITNLEYDFPMNQILKYHDLKEKLLMEIQKINHPSIIKINFLNSKSYEEYNNFSLTFNNIIIMDDRKPLHYVIQIDLDNCTFYVNQVSSGGILLKLKT